MNTVDLGDFPQGAIPEPLVHTFLDHRGRPWDFTDYVVEPFEVLGPEGSELDGTAEITGGGEVTYEWGTFDMSVPGTYQGVLWVVDDAEDPTLRHPSSLFRWRVWPVIPEGESS